MTYYKYGHLIPSMQADVAEMIDELITPIELHQSSPNCNRSAADLALEPATEDHNPHIQAK